MRPSHYSGLEQGVDIGTREPKLAHDLRAMLTDRGSGSKQSRSFATEPHRWIGLMNSTKDGMVELVDMAPRLDLRV
jgi:hypothetical protein